MKKSFLMIAAALFILAGCQKEESVKESTSNNVIHIGVKQIAPATKVAAVDIAANKLSFKWEEGDQVAFTDNDNYERIIIYTCTNPATGEFSGEALDPDATYWVEYPNGYSGTFIYRGNQIPKGHFITNNEEVSGSATTFTLDRHETIIHFKLKGAAKVGSIALSNGYADDDYTLSCGDGVQLSDTATDFYMDAMYMDSHKLSSFAYTLHIYDTNNKELKSVSFHLKEENQETIVDFATPIEVNAAPSIPAGALKGEFSVSATKKVHFSQGNLWYGKVGDAQTATFNFEANQYDSTPSEGGDWEASHVSHFYWSKTASVAYAASYSESGTAFTDVFFTNATAETAKSDFTVNGVTGKYRTLSTAEWQYLFNTRTMKNGKDRYTLNITYGGKMGLVLYPDDYDKDPVTGTVTDLPDGVVFLPAAGFRDDDGVYGVGYNGCYWSSSPNGEFSAHNVFFDSDLVYPDTDDSRSNGLSVRLVTEVLCTSGENSTGFGSYNDGGSY